MSSLVGSTVPLQEAPPTSFFEEIEGLVNSGNTRLEYSLVLRSWLPFSRVGIYGLELLFDFVNCQRLNLSAEAASKLQQHITLLKKLNEGPLKILLPEEIRDHMGVDQDLGDYLDMCDDKDQAAAQYHALRRVFPELYCKKPQPWPQLMMAWKSYRKLLAHKVNWELDEESQGPYLAWCFCAQEPQEIELACDAMEEYDRYLFENGLLQEKALSVAGSKPNLRGFVVDLLHYINAMEDLLTSLGWQNNGGKNGD